MQRILSSLRKAVEEFNMIEEGDKIAVAVSGGKDSLTLLLALKNLQIFFPKHFDIMALTIDPGFEEFNSAFIENFCKEHEIEYHIEHTSIKQIVFDERNEKNPCSLCANLRRGILHSTAVQYGCNKIALGHNLDDVLETFFLNLLYGGRIHTFSPKTYLDRSNITVIRPLVFTEEKEIKRFIKKDNITPMDKCCPMDGISKREDMKELISSFKLEIPTIKSNLMGAILRSNIDGWKEKQQRKRGCPNIINL